MKIVIALIIVAIILALIGPPFMDLYQSSTKDGCGYIAKHQWMRLFDVFVLGPLGIYLGYKVLNKQDIHPTWGAMMIAYGVGTITYNGNNYLYNVNK